MVKYMCMHGQVHVYAGQVHVYAWSSVHVYAGQVHTVGDKIKFPYRLKKSLESRYKVAKQFPQTSDFPHKSRLQLRVKSV